MVSTDGSCLKNPGGATGWAWVNHHGESCSGGAASGTNQIAELRAVLEAINAHPGDEPLMIESDSQYAIKCSTEWLPGWKRRGWKTASGSPVKNIELVRAIDAAISDRTGPVRFRWVRGHVGNEFNEMADALAGEAARAARDGKATQPAPSEQSGAAQQGDEQQNDRQHSELQQGEPQRGGSERPAPQPAAPAAAEPPADEILTLF